METKIMELQIIVEELQKRMNKADELLKLQSKVNEEMVAVIEKLGLMIKV